MANPVTTGSMCTCTFGAAPGTVSVTTQMQVMSKMPVGTIMEKVVTPFGVCLMGPVPIPCTPLITSWIPACPTIMVSKKPILTTQCKGICGKGGMISFINSPAVTIKTP